MVTMPTVLDINGTDITNLSATARTINTDPDAIPQNLTGPYQVEIRRGYEYAQLGSQTSGTIVVEETFDTNDRQAAGYVRFRQISADQFDEEATGSTHSKKAKSFSVVPMPPVRPASFGRDDLPLLAKVADMAYAWIWEQEATGAGSPTPS